MGWTQRTVWAAVFAVGITGCSVSAELPRNTPAATCDGGPSFGNPETVLRTLLEAASRADIILACTVTTGTPEGMDLGKELARLDGEARERGITAENLRLEKLGDGGPAGRYAAIGPSSGMEPLEFGLVQQTDGGFPRQLPAHGEAQPLRPTSVRGLRLCLATGGLQDSPARHFSSLENSTIRLSCHHVSQPDTGLGVMNIGCKTLSGPSWEN